MLDWFFNRFTTNDNDIFADLKAERRKQKRCKHRWTAWSIGLHPVTLAQKSRTHRCMECGKIEREKAKTIWVKK